jgi:hypothetical protein
MKRDAFFLNYNIRLILISVLFAFIGLSLIASLPDSNTYTDSQERIQIAEIESFDNDSDSEKTKITAFDLLPTVYVLTLTHVYVRAIKSLKFARLQLTFHYDISPRAPPTFQS